MEFQNGKIYTIRSFQTEKYVPQRGQRGKAGLNMVKAGVKMVKADLKTKPLTKIIKPTRIPIIGR